MDGAASFRAAKSAAYTGAPRPRAVWGLVAALALLVPFSFIPAVALMNDPSGASLQIPDVYRALLPVPDFFLVGVFLLAFYSLAPVAIVAGLVTRGEWGPTRWVGRRLGFHWAWFAAVTLGAVMVGWIATEMVLFQSAPAPQMTLLWVVCLLIAAVIFLAAAPRKVRAYYRVAPTASRAARATPA